MIKCPHCHHEVYGVGPEAVERMARQHEPYKCPNCRQAITALAPDIKDGLDRPTTLRKDDDDFTPFRDDQSDPFGDAMASTAATIIGEDIAQSLTPDPPFDPGGGSFGGGGSDDSW